jgi:hypothetical protein
MLSLHDTNGRINRRQLLSIGSLALGGLSLSSLLAHRAAAAASASPAAGKSVIFLHQQGGPSQFETFDPKPEAPADVRTLTDCVRTVITRMKRGRRAVSSV